MKKINKKQAAPADLDKLALLSRVMQKACLCGLGQAAPGPIVTTLEHFNAEYQARLQI